MSLIVLNDKNTLIYHMNEVSQLDFAFKIVCSTRNFTILSVLEFANNSATISFYSLFVFIKDKM